MQIGCEHFGSTLHFGPDYTQDAWLSASYSKNSPPGRGFDKDFHRYQLEWTEDHLKFSVDDTEVGLVTVGDGFWQRGHFQGDNIWQGASLDAPFDQEVEVGLGVRSEFVK